MGISTHILDISLGKPVFGLEVFLWKKSDEIYVNLSHGTSDSNGRINFLDEPEINSYKLEFLVEEYFKKQQIKSFYPKISIDFSILDNQHYHIPLLLSPFGFSTYRGS
jgi:5-hydroxyisourate hydrolase